MLVEVSPTVAFNSEEISSVEFVFDDSAWRQLYGFGMWGNEENYKQMREQAAKAPKRYYTKYVLRSGKEYDTTPKREDEAKAEWMWAKALVNSQDE